MTEIWLEAQANWTSKGHLGQQILEGGRLDHDKSVEVTPLLVQTGQVLPLACDDMLLVINWDQTGTHKAAILLVLSLQAFVVHVKHL